MKVPDNNQPNSKKTPRRVKVTTTCTTYVDAEFFYDTGDGKRSNNHQIIEDKLTTEDIIDYIQKHLDGGYENLTQYAWDNELIGTDGGFEMDVELV
jgi:hypothetical protein